MSNNFRDLIPSPDDPRVIGLAERDAFQHAAQRLESPRGKLFMDSLRRRHAETFKGITCDGQINPDLFPLADEGAPINAMLAAARALLDVMDGDEKLKVCQDIDSFTWRIWSNPELYVNPFGVRLDVSRPELVTAIMRLLQASMSNAGYEKTRNCMRVNHFLGELVNAPRIMNEYSYNFLLYGEPSLTEPWGWNFYGHHLCLSCFVIGKQMVISPTFMGAEPNQIDSGTWAGTRIFDDEERKGLDLMRSLPEAVRNDAHIYQRMNDPDMPPGRRVPGDLLHQGGAFQDNRVVPYEGVSVSRFASTTQRNLLDLAAAFLCYLPDGPRTARLNQIEKHFAATRFAWIGGYGDNDPFYYKIHSPVVMIEFDHHSGVFLTNTEPAKCHIHTLVRTPNGNDYGRDLLRQHYDSVHPGRLPGGLRRPYCGI